MGQRPLKALKGASSDRTINLAIWTRPENGHLPVTRKEFMAILAHYDRQNESWLSKLGRHARSVLVALLTRSRQ